MAIFAGAVASLSNMVSNVPAVMLLQPVMLQFHDPQPAWLMLAMASTLAGNLTITGSVANIIVVEKARCAHQFQRLLPRRTSNHNSHVAFRSCMAPLHSLNSHSDFTYNSDHNLRTRRQYSRNISKECVCDLSTATDLVPTLSSRT
jgi:hypothetical protein